MRAFFSLLIVLAFLVPVTVSGDTITSSVFSIQNSVMQAGATIRSASYGLGQSVSQSVIGRSLSASFQVWSGFQYYATADPFVLSATPGTGQVSLSWQAPVVHNGGIIASYEVGIGTTSGSYVFQSVSSATSYLKTGLSNQTTYYVIVKAMSASGVPLSFSNQVSIVTLGDTVVPPTGGGGGGGGGSSVGNATIVVSGLAYPGARVTILLDGRSEATTTADPGAQFKVTIAQLKAGSYVLSVYAEDSASRKSSSYSVPLEIAASVTAEVSNIFLAPTIAVSNQTVPQGTPINIFGTAAPNAQVNIHVHSAQEFIEKVTATAAGIWFKQFDTSFLEVGKHETYSRAVANDRVTDESAIVKFNVSDKGTLPVVEGMRSDLNTDTRVNTIDFSMLLYWWQRVPTAPSKADINKDGIVDAVDLSIMLYDWTG